MSGGKGTRVLLLLWIAGSVVLGRFFTARAMERFEREVRPDVERGRPEFLVAGADLFAVGSSRVDPALVWFSNLIDERYVIVDRVGPFRIAMLAETAAARGVPPLDAAAPDPNG
ncbi:MAG: hypothetical protein JW958_03860 [Candidatus Eisenbacteria bacterium]|nr:hypothetical protein [Candidatus Eisenbacteria bacterium]